MINPCCHLAEDLAQIGPRSPECHRTSAAFILQVCAINKLCTEQLAAGNRVVVIGSHVQDDVVRDVIRRSYSAGWVVRHSKKKDDQNAAELHFRAKRKNNKKPPAEPASTP
mgnify:CR=1 FL=1